MLWLQSEMKWNVFIVVLRSIYRALKCQRFHYKIFFSSQYYIGSRVGCKDNWIRRAELTWRRRIWHNNLCCNHSEAFLRTPKMIFNFQQWKLRTNERNEKNESLQSVCVCSVLSYWQSETYTFHSFSHFSFDFHCSLNLTAHPQHTFITSQC